MVMGLIGIDLARPASPPSRQRAHRGHVLQQRREQQGVVDVGGGYHGGQRQPAAVADQVKLGPWLAAIDGTAILGRLLRAKERGGNRESRGRTPSARADCGHEPERDLGELSAVSLQGWEVRRPPLEIVAGRPQVTIEQVWRSGRRGGSLP
jgi:hypothetical protein